MPEPLAVGTGHGLPVIGWSMIASALLQVIRGFQSEAAASVSLWMLTQIAATFGYVLYLLQREHVQALVRRRTLLHSFRRAHGDAS